MWESSSKSSFFALKTVCSGAIEAISSKALGAVAAGAGALEAAAVAVCTGALEAAAAVVAAAAVARVIRLCLGLLRLSGVFIVPKIRFSR